MMTISGTVVNGTSNPVNGAEVMINHDPARVVTTGLDGRFEFADVIAPYTLSVVAGTTVIEHQEISGLHPQLSTAPAGAKYVATLAGNIQSPALPLPPGQLILLGATNGVVTNGFADFAGAYDAEFQWSGNTMKTADLGALHLSVAAPENRIISYWQTGELPWVTLDPGMNESGLDFALSAPVATANTILQYDPGAYSVGAKGGYAMLAVDDARFSAAELGAALASGSQVLLPSGGATFAISGEDSEGNSAVRIGTAILGGTTTLDLPVNTLLENSLPAHDATDVSRTPTLSWTPVIGADIYLIQLIGAGIELFAILPGSSASLTIADYTPLGLGLIGNTTYSWNVTALESSGVSVDSLTDPATAAFFTVDMPQASSLNLYFSASQSFTTAP